MEQTKGKILLREEAEKALKENEDYIKEHTENVKKAFTILVKLGIIEPDTEVYKRALTAVLVHDESKNSVEEFTPYALRFFTPNGKERYKEEFDYAWLHHIHRNPHHWNYWVLVDGVGKITALEMPEHYVYEMICDWLSFGIKKGDLTEIKSFNDSKRDEYILHPNTRKLVDEIIGKIMDAVADEKNAKVLEEYGLSHKKNDG